MPASEFDLLVRGGSIVFLDGVRQADIGVSNGVIVAIEPELEGSASEVVDATGKHVLAGGVDPHVHFNDPGRAHWEGADHGSCALAVGGTTSFVDMPLNSSPPTVDAESLQLKREALAKTSRVDFAAWGGLVPGPIEHLDELAAGGVIGFKAFMSASGIADFSYADDLTLYEGMCRAADLGLPVAVHAESNSITTELAGRAMREGRLSMPDYLNSRPIVAEIEAIGRAVLLAQQAGCALHVVHVSTGRGVAMIAEAAASGVDVTCETCPHYLLLTDEDAERLGSIAKCAPPLRSATSREALWKQVGSGDIQMITSDHSPSPPNLKNDRDLFSAWGGIAGAQTMLQLIVDEGHLRRGLSLSRLSDLLSRQAARRFQLAGKGEIALGYDADLAIFDLSATDVIDSANLLSRHKISPYAGRKVNCRVTSTYLRGQLVAHEGKLVGSPIGKAILTSQAASTVSQSQPQ